MARDKVFGGEIVARILRGEGVDHLFGIIDGTYFGFYSKLAENGIKLLTPRHETSAVHMAGAYARLTGRLGVCMASNGPGVANALPGVAVEEAEGNRVLLITSSRREGIIYPDRGGTFQYFPQVDVIRQMAKWSQAVSSYDRVAELTRAALRACFSGRPGVVHLDIPESIMNGTFDVDESWFRPPEQYRATSPLHPDPIQVREASKLLARAERPMIHAGSGVLHARATEELAALAERLEAPVTTSWAARAAMDERSRYAVPMIYLGAVKTVRNQADVVLVLGSRLGETDFWGKPPYWAPPARQKVVQVDIDPLVLGNNRPADLAVIGDVRVFLQELLREFDRRTDHPQQQTRRTWVDAIQAEVAERRQKLDQNLKKKDIPLHPALVPHACRNVFDDDAVLVIDGGNTALWAHFYHQVRAPYTVLTTPKMGMLGAGVSQALGAKVAFPDRQVYCIIGDGAMGFHPQEVETAVRNRLQVVWLVLCDKQWGMVKMNQQFALKPLKTVIKKSLSPDETINTELGEIEFDQLARAMGAYGERVADPEDLENAIKRALASRQPAVIHVDVDPVAHLWAPELKTFKEMHLEPEG